MIKLADTLVPMSNDFYAVESKNVGIDIDGTSKSIQQAYADGDLSGDGSAIQVDLLPPPSVDELGKIYEFIGSTGTYVNGYFYECVSDGEPTPTYSWVQKNVQPNTNIVDTAIETTSTWSSKKISDSLVNIADKLEKKADVSDLANKQDFRIFNSLEEFNEKKGTSLTVVSGIDNMKDIANAMSNGEMLIITTKCELGSEVYFGLTKNTGWTKMFTFIKSNELCDVECRTTFPLTLKRVLNSDGVIGDWQELATTTQLSGSVDCNTLTETGLYTASAGAVSSLTNSPANIGSTVQLDGGFSILVTKTNVDSIYYGMQMFIPYGSDVPFIRKSYYLNGQYWTPWVDIITSNNIGNQTVASANKIEPNYTKVELTAVTSNTIKYIKIADCNVYQAGTLQVFFRGDSLIDTLVINFGSGTALEPMLCGYYSGNDHAVYSVIAQKGSSWNQSYSIYVKVNQTSNCNVNVALLKGDCTVNITESTTAPTNIYEWTVKYGFFGDFTGNLTGNVTGNAKTANKIEPNYTSVSLPLVTSTTTKYIKVADCPWNSTGTLQVSLSGANLQDTLVINFGSGNALEPMLCGYYSGNSFGVSSVIVQKGSDWIQNYSIYVKVRQTVNCDVKVALLKGECTINVTESTTAPTNITEYPVNYGLFGNIASPEIISLEQRVSALESKL